MNRGKNKTPKKRLTVWQKSTVFVILASFVFSPLFSTLDQNNVAKAQITAAAGLMVPVDDVIGNLRDGLFDGIAWSVAKLAVQEITRSTVNWINNGFEGNPGFLENPGQFFKDLADDVLGDFIEGTEFGFLCSPFQIQIKLALIKKHYGSRIPSCSLSDILNNVQNFEDFVSISDVSSTQNIGGWSDWYNLTQPAGNPYGAYAAAEAELGLRISTSRGTIQKDLDLGGGLLSFRDCSGVTDKGPKNINCPIKTPGSVIENQLNNVLATPLEGLIAADEINEVISALLGQLLSQVFGGDGLSGTSQSNSNFGGNSYLDALSDDSSSTLSTNREILDSRINETVAILDEYIRIKNQSVSRVSSSINLQNQIVARCGETSPQATSANMMLISTINPINARLLGDTSLANSQKEALGQIKIDASSLLVSDTNGFTLLFNRYTEIRSQIAPETIISVAQNERDITIPQQLNPIDTTVQTTINSCNIIPWFLYKK